MQETATVTAPATNLETRGKTPFEVKCLRALAWVGLVTGMLMVVISAYGASQITYGGGTIVVLAAMLPWLFGSLLSFSLLLAFASITENLYRIRELLPHKEI